MTTTGAINKIEIIYLENGRKSIVLHLDDRYPSDLIHDFTQIKNIINQDTTPIRQVDPPRNANSAANPAASLADLYFNNLSRAVSMPLINPIELPSLINQSRLSEHKRNDARNSGGISRNPGSEAREASNTGVDNSDTNELLHSIAHMVLVKIQEHNMPHPNLTNRTYSGRQKIKNFVHNVTGIWLKKDEIDIFVREIMKIANQNA